ncbi:keratin, type II cytoskeletal [Musa troglodytarum]|uniref:Keratin, type II cytoskeletal n=1 Tax=Musa troglodytarum TaxID=320322 RepID=A0A9E7KHR6_9LILI|nr:keratin, type II cytoskeletal [Musa troglodytarum]
MGRFQKYYPFSAPLSFPTHHHHCSSRLPSPSPIPPHPHHRHPHPLSLSLRFLQLLTLQVERDYVGFASFPLPLLWRILLRIASGSRCVTFSCFRFLYSVSVEFSLAYVCFLGIFFLG